MYENIYNAKISMLYDLQTPDISNDMGEWQEQKVKVINECLS